MSWFGNNSTAPITFEESSAYYARKGLADEQPDESYECACVQEHLFGVDAHCPACRGTGVVDEPNTWCDVCGLSGACRDCDPDRERDARLDR